VAALSLLNRLTTLDLPRLTRWVAQRQGCVEGGFNGRTNKLVDGCYSFWQGAVLPLLRRAGGALVEQALAVGVVCEGDAGWEVPELPLFGGVCTPYEEVCLHLRLFSCGVGVGGCFGVGAGRDSREEELY